MDWATSGRRRTKAWRAFSSYVASRTGAAAAQERAGASVLASAWQGEGQAGGRGVGVMVVVVGGGGGVDHRLGC
jgi:hypothetical protein